MTPSTSHHYKAIDLVDDPKLTEVNYVDDVLALPEADEEIIGLHVSVDEALRVNVFQSAQQLRERFPSRKKI